MLENKMWLKKKKKIIIKMEEWIETAILYGFFVVVNL